MARNDIINTDGTINFDELASHMKLMSGTTVNRPTTKLIVGQMYYDTTLGKPIWCHQVSPIVWHDSTGAIV